MTWSTKSVCLFIKKISNSNFQNVTCFRHDMAKNCLILASNNNHSPTIPYNIHNTKNTENTITLVSDMHSWTIRKQHNIRINKKKKHTKMLTMFPDKIRLKHQMFIKWFLKGKNKGQTFILWVLKHVYYKALMFRFPRKSC